MLSRIAYLRRPFAVALLLALIYQAGACPCGCWGESIWQTMLGDASCWLSGTGAAGDVHCAGELACERTGPLASRPDDRTIPLGGHESRPATLAATDEHSDCEEQARIARRDGRPSLRDLRAGLPGGYALTPPALGLPWSTRLKLRSIESRHAAETRADARAFLQVFRL